MVYIWILKNLDGKLLLCLTFLRVCMKLFKYFFNLKDKVKFESYCVMKKFVIFNMVRMIIWSNVIIMFIEGVVIFYEIEVSVNCFREFIWVSEFRVFKLFLFSW